MGISFGYRKDIVYNWGFLLSRAIDKFWIEKAFCYGLVGIIWLQTTIITAMIAHMACGFAVLHHLYQQAVLFTIHENVAHLLHVARLLTLAPDSIPCAAKKVGVTRFAC